MDSQVVRHEKEYENTPGSVERYLNTPEPFLVEVTAVRTWQCLNGCVSLDWAYENCVVYTIRVVAPAFRIANFLTGVYLIILSQFVLSWPLVFRYDLFQSNTTMRAGNVTVNACMMLWALDFVFLSAAYFFVNTNTKRKEWWLWSAIGYRPHHCLSAIIYGAIYAAVAVVGIISTHTVLSHMWHVQNAWFAALLLLQSIMLIVSTLGDAINTGSPWGIQEASRVASVLLGLRLRALVPMTVIFSVASVFAAWPPSYCAQC